MDAEFVTDKLNIKSLLFTKAIPNYNRPETGGHKVFACIDCGDRYIMESSYNYHINRKSVKITYKCRHCGVVKIFFNRCNLLSHIRSHAFKTATINVSDLKVEPLPIDFFTKFTSHAICSQTNNTFYKVQSSSSICYECKEDIINTGIAYKDRAKHYMQYTNDLHSCPICMFTLPTVCALKAHIRLHLKTPPFYCPECGVNLPNKSIHYPYGHDCEGIKMMRATARLICSMECSQICHPNQLNQHVKTQHLKKIYKCPVCVVACFSEKSIQNHLKNHSYDVKPILFYQCEKCSGKLVLQSQIDNHVKTHGNSFGFPCWICGTVFKEVTSLLNHHMENHLQEVNITKQWYESVLNEKKKEYVMYKNDSGNNNLNLTSKKDKMNAQRNKSSKLSQLQRNKPNKQHVICHLCKNKISQNWNVIKKHYANCHKHIKCVDIKIVLKKCSIKEYELEKNKKLRSKMLIGKEIYQNKKNVKINDKSVSNNLYHSESEKNEFTCPICNERNDNKEFLEKHMTCHRDPYMAYQCLECGQSFAVKPSFSTHLLLVHGISDVTDYILKKQCYNENALVKYLSSSENEEPLKENQCQICRSQFENSNNLQKHFRVHGMAFLLKTTEEVTKSISTFIISMFYCHLCPFLKM